jgi:hypothetical protein
MGFTRPLSLTTVCLFSSLQEGLLRTERSFYVEPAALADYLYLFSREPRVEEAQSSRTEHLFRVPNILKGQ